MEKDLLCAFAQNCGLEVITEGSKILQVRADRDNPRSQGFMCRKGTNIAYFQNNPERLKFPLKRVVSRFERISWNQALDEIAAKLKEISRNPWPPVHSLYGWRRSGLPFPIAFGVPSFGGWGPITTTAPWPRSTLVFFGWKGRLWPPESCIRVPDIGRFGFPCLLGSQSHGEQHDFPEPLW